MLASEGFDQSVAAGARAWESNSSDVFNVPDFMSWLLFRFGDLAAGFAAYKGYGMEDPYPGYSRRARAFKAAQDRFQEEYDDVIDEISEFQEDAAKSVEQHLQNLRIRKSSAREAFAMASQLRGRLVSERGKLALDLEFLHAKRCPDEKPVRLDPLPSEASLPERLWSRALQTIRGGADRGAKEDSGPLSDDTDTAKVADLVQRMVTELSQRCAAVLERLRNSDA